MSKTPELPEVFGPIAITGSPVDDLTRPPVRRELRDMHHNYPKEWALFLIGLDRFKKTDESHPLSYYQIAGIHGMPFETWPIADWNKIKEVQSAKGQWKGFCTHSSILFLPWHRPYLALFETELRRHVQAVAEQYTVEQGRDDYLKAAKTFRLPYWDWALPIEKDNGAFPIEAAKTETHPVIFPKNYDLGFDKFDENPLARYKFGELGSKNEQIQGWKKTAGTVRWPNSANAEKDQNEKIQDLITDRDGQFARKGKNLTERVLFLLKSYDSFAPVSTNRFFRQQKFENWGSLEDVHNAIHYYVGMKGHMGDPQVAAFDPIFWLHHTNIDRLYAIWQALWDKGGAGQYVQDEKTMEGTYSSFWKGTDTIDTELTPFTQSADGSMWTSRDFKYTSTFGYVYPETQSWLYPTKKAILKQLDDTYPNATLSSTIKKDQQKREIATKTLQARASTLLALETTSLKTSELVQLSSKDANDAQQSLIATAKQVELPASPSLGSLAQDNKYLEWLVNLRAEKHSLGGDFIVHVFLGAPEDDNPELYILNPSHVASFSTFGTDEATGCEKCKEGQEAHLEVTGQIPLTLALVERYLAGKLASIKPEDVIPYLQKDLHWRVTNRTGIRSSRADVEGLLVSVVSNEVTLPEGPLDLPQYSPIVTPWSDATTRANGEGRGKGTGYTGEV